MIQNLQNFIKGDIIGFTFEMQKNPVLDLKQIELGVWSDDTSQMMCVIESIMESTDVLSFYEAFRYKLMKWLYEGYMTPNKKAIGIGSTTRNAIDNMSLRKPVENEKLSTGALMRCAPFLFMPNLKYLDNTITITHKNPEHEKYCLNYINMYKNKSRPELIINREEVDWIGNRVDDVWNFIVYNYDLIYLPEILNKVLNKGGDTDTALCLIGALNDEEFLPDIKVNISDVLLDVIYKFDKFLSKYEKL